MSRRKERNKDGKRKANIKEVIEVEMKKASTVSDGTSMLFYFLFFFYFIFFTTALFPKVNVNGAVLR